MNHSPATVFTLQKPKTTLRWWLAATLLIVLGSHVALANTNSQTNTIAVRGDGVASAEPNQAHFDAGVSITHQELQRALDEANEIMTRVLETLQREGIAEQDIQTTRFQIRQEEPRDQPRRFRVSNTVRVTVNDLERLGALVSLSVEAGANELGNIRFAHDDPAALERQAREAAVQNAREKAEQLAQFAGVSLGPVLSISEPQAGAPTSAQPMMMRAEAADSVPIAAGELSVQVSVQVEFGLTE